MPEESEAKQDYTFDKEEIEEMGLAMRREPALDAMGDEYWQSVLYVRDKTPAAVDGLFSTMSIAQDAKNRGQLSKQYYQYMDNAFAAALAALGAPDPEPTPEQQKYIDAYARQQCAEREERNAKRQADQAVRDAHDMSIMAKIREERVVEKAVAGLANAFTRNNPQKWQATMGALQEAFAPLLLHSGLTPEEKKDFLPKMVNTCLKDTWSSVTNVPLPEDISNNTLTRAQEGGASVAHQEALATQRGNPSEERPR